MTNIQKIANEFGIENPLDWAEGGIQNRRLRELVLTLGEEDAEFRNQMRGLAQKDWHLFFNLFLWTYDPRPDAYPHHFPFVTWPYQDKFLSWLVNDIIEYSYEDKGGRRRVGRDGFVDKSRDMGASWLVIGIIVWYWCKDDAGNDFRLGSRKQDYVDKLGDMDTLMEKARYLLSRLPWWLLPPGFKMDKHTKLLQITNPLTGCTIVGEANNPNFGTGGRRKMILLDEFSKWEQTDDKAWTSCAQATNTRLALSTPWGTSERKFHKLHEEAKQGRIPHHRMHWSAHPFKDDAWYEIQKRKMTPQEVAQELDINYEGAAGEQFFTTYNGDIHKRDSLRPLSYTTVYLLWDFGFRHPCALFTQLNEVYDQWLWLHVILGRSIPAPEFAKYVLRKQAEWFPETDDIVHVGDPAAEYSDVREIENEMRAAGIDMMIHTRTRQGVRLNQDRQGSARVLRNLFGEFVNGQPRIVIRGEEDDRHLQNKPYYIETQSMYYIEQALLGGAHYAEGTRIEIDCYDKDGYYDHGMDAARYGAKYLFPDGAALTDNTFVKQNKAAVQRIDEVRNVRKFAKQQQTQRSARQVVPVRTVH